MQNHPATEAEAVDISADDHTFTKKVRGLYVGTGGDVIVNFGGNSITFPNVQDGSILPIAIDAVIKTGTDASDMVGLY